MADAIAERKTRKSSQPHSRLPIESPVSVSPSLELYRLPESSCSRQGSTLAPIIVASQQKTTWAHGSLADFYTGGP